MKSLFVLLASDSGFSSEINNILSSYIRPILIVLIILAVAKSIINSIEMIADKQENGTTKDGWFKLAIIVGAVALAIIVINVVINKLTGVSLSI